MDINQSNRTSIRLLKISDLQQSADVSRAQVNRWLASGVLPFLKLGKSVRIREEDWAQFLNTLVAVRAK